jgi:hypothetical protein
LAQRGSRKRRKRKPRPVEEPAQSEDAEDAERPRDTADAERRRDTADAGRPRDTADAMARAYARGRERDEAARAELEPLAEGERPRAVTAGALVAAALALAEVISFALAYDPDESNRIVRSVLVVGLLGVMAWGMWNVRYWAVLGMQTLLGITIVYASAAALFATNLNAVVLVVAIVVPAGALFWFLVKSMARIQMPEGPGTRGTG